jgi:hypothetical protein
MDISREVRYMVDTADATMRRRRGSFCSVESGPLMIGDFLLQFRRSCDIAAPRLGQLQPLSHEIPVLTFDQRGDEIQSPQEYDQRCWH